MSLLMPDSQTSFRALFEYAPIGTIVVNTNRKIVLANSNAVKYSEKNVEINTHVAPGKVSISVRDRGIGIPADEQKYMFDRFFRAANVSTIQSTGLGLNIVHRYVDLMNGSISFESVSNKRTVFLVELPQQVTSW